MLDFLYQNGWGAFTIMLFFQVPFLIVFFYIVYRKAVTDPGPSGTDDSRISRIEGWWVAVVIVLFIGVNVISIKYMPTVATAAAATTEQNIQNVDVTAQSWSYQISDRQFEVGRPVRFTVKSVDTVHGFGVYHPAGRLLFTMMMIPGMEPASIIHTFTEPGKYKVRCLEYCGIAHHAMADEFVVAASGE
jgi:cytochrome c oxidase subunit II